jgi:methylenetetrahydrofolate dehydrogenase (NADP+)/methenyltetrahydrofolate cyclohydrolase
VTCRWLRGEPLARALLEEAIREAKVVVELLGRVPRLVAVEAGRETATEVYGTRKRRVARDVGIETVVARVDPSGGVEAFEEKLRELSADPSVDGITLERPLPKGLDAIALHELVAPEKDVEGLHPANMGRLVSGAPVRFVPCAAEAALALARESGIAFAGAQVVVLGAGFGVGRPVALLLLAADATVEVCHAATRDLSARTRHADLLIACAGVPGLVTKSMVKEGAVVIDVGTTVVVGDSGAAEVRGDVLPEVSETASALTPVPGGVGPVTVALVLRNAARAARLSAEARES